MSDNKNFDQYIKGLFDEDPKVPSELQWEAMNFDLPNNTPEPKQSNRKYISLLLLLLLFITSAAIYFAVNKSQTNNIQASNSPAQKPANNTTSFNDTNTTLEKETQEINSLQKNTAIASSVETSTTEISKLPNAETNTSASNQEKTVTKKAKDSDLNNTPKSEGTKQREQTFKPTIGGTPKTGDNFQNKSVNTDSSPTNIQSTNRIEKSEVQSTDLLPGILFKSLAIVYDNKLNIELNPLPINKKDKEENKKNFKLSEILLGYGYNDFDLKTDDSNILNDKINKIFGTSYSLGVRLNINKKWFANTILKYDQYHTTFDHTQDLAPIIDIQSLRRTNREEVTFHNNFTKTLGLQFGLERRFQISDHLFLYTGLSLTPTYAVSSTGKTTDNNSVTFFETNDQPKRLSLNGGLNAGVAFPINKTISLEMNYQFNRFFLNEIFINNGMNTNQQSVLSFMISYKLQK